MTNILPLSWRVAKAFGVGLLLLFLFGAMVSCQRVDPVIKIGFVAPFEGRDRQIGYDAIYSARLAIREINQSGGINGYKIELVALDDGGDPELALQVAQSLLIDPDVVVVIGHWLPENNALVAPLYETAEMAFIPTGSPPLALFDNSNLPTQFLARYAASTPFDEVAGPYAGPAYDSLQFAFAAIATGTESSEANRATIREALARQTIEGVTGSISLPGGP